MFLIPVWFDKKFSFWSKATSIFFYLQMAELSYVLSIHM